MRELWRYGRRDQRYAAGAFLTTLYFGDPADSDGFRVI